MRIAILGAGRHGKSLGTALRASRHHIVYGGREPAASRDLMSKGVGGAIAGADTVIIATPWTAAEALVREHAPALSDKIVIDATNPLSPNATRLALGFDTSGVEVLRSHAHGATLFSRLSKPLGSAPSPSRHTRKAGHRCLSRTRRGRRWTSCSASWPMWASSQWTQATSAPRVYSSPWECCGFNSRKPRGEAISPSCWRPASGNSLNPYALAETPAATLERE